jgi:hypothetical protein
MFVELARPLAEYHVSIGLDMILADVILCGEPWLSEEDLLELCDNLLQANEVSV